MASSNSGTCWYSSIRTSWFDSTNLAGSSRTADLVAGSSQSITDRPSRSPSWLSRVLLPTVLGPLRTTTGSSVSLASTTSTSRLFARPVKAPRITRILALGFRDSNGHFPCFQTLSSVFPLHSDRRSLQGFGRDRRFGPEIADAGRQADGPSALTAPGRSRVPRSRPAAGAAVGAGQQYPLIR